MTLKDDNYFGNHIKNLEFFENFDFNLSFAILCFVDLK